MKVAIFSDTFPPEINGVATSTRNLYRTLKSHGEEVLVVTTNFFGKELNLDEDILRIPGFRMKMYDYRVAGPYSPGAMRILAKFKPEVIHIQTDAGIGQFGFIAAKKLNVPVVYTFHTSLEDYSYYATHGFFDRAVKGIIRTYVRYKSNEAKEFITPSGKIKEYMRSIGVDAYINVIPTGIDFSAFDRKKISQEAIKELKIKHGIPEGKYVLLSLGRVAKEKSIDLCLEGYARYLHETHDDNTVFVIVGGGPALEELKELSQTLGIENKVIFIGPVPPDTVPLYYQLGDLFVSASITETQGLTFMEAMSASLLLLVRYDDTLINTIKDGENGFFFLDEGDMAAKIKRIKALDSLEKEKIRKLALEGLEEYSMDNFYHRVIKVYERAIKRDW